MFSYCARVLAGFRPEWPVLIRGVACFDQIAFRLAGGTVDGADRADYLLRALIGTTLRSPR